MTQSNALDEFFTKPDVADYCISIIDALALKYVANDGRFTYIEPSAGAGAFLQPIRKHSRAFRAFDIKPQGADIIGLDFLTVTDEDLHGGANGITNVGGDPSDDIPDHSDPIVFIGNPPFGKRASLALRFLNIALDHSSLVGFILPVQFNKYLTQKAVTPDASLIINERLRDDAFTENGADVSVRTVFQVWARGIRTDEHDLRIRNAPAIRHPDFDMFTYNCTRQAEKYFDYDWDIAVRRQGWGHLEVTPRSGASTLDRHKQYMFLKAGSPDVLDRLSGIDYTALGMGNTSVPGFGKADVVSEYQRLYERTDADAEPGRE